MNGARARCCSAAPECRAKGGWSRAHSAERETAGAERERARRLRRACAGCAVGLTELDRYMTVTDVKFVVWHLPTYAEPLIWMSKSTYLPIQGAPRGITDPLFGRCAEPWCARWIVCRL